MPYQFEIRSDTIANWVSNDSLLALGEPGYETDTGRTKIGDGSTGYTLLPYSTIPPYYAAPPVFDTPEAHGAHRNGNTDDTAAIKAAIANVVSKGQANGTNYGEVWFSPGQYAVKGALDTTKVGRSQIPLPVVDQANNQCFVLVLKGIADGNAREHWFQTAPQKAGAVLLSNLSATFDSGLGVASIIGGPTLQQFTSGNWSNMLLVIDGLQIGSSYEDPAHTAVNLQCLSQANIKNLGINGFVNQTSLTTPTNASGLGLWMPRVGNNNKSEIGDLTVRGYYTGMYFNEHMNAKRIQAYVCHYGMCPDGSMNDGAHVDYLSTEACAYHISDGNNVGSGRWMLDVDTWDIEDNSPLPTVRHLDDQNNMLYGRLNYRRNASASNANPDGLTGLGGSLVINGATHAELHNMGVSPGTVTPSISAASANFVNPYDRPAFVKVSGGTGVSVTVDGQARTVGEWAPVRSRGVVNLGAYTAAPTWLWYLM